MSRLDEDAPVMEVVEDASSGTKAYYVPSEPRRPAAPTPPPPSELMRRTIAESFQDMLRQAYAAGARAAKSGEPFEVWYQREVLR